MISSRVIISAPGLKSKLSRPMYRLLSRLTPPSEKRERETNRKCRHEISVDRALLSHGLACAIYIALYLSSMRSDTLPVKRRGWILDSERSSERWSRGKSETKMEVVGDDDDGRCGLRNRSVQTNRPGRGRRKALDSKGAIARSNQSGFPLATCFLVRKVFGNLPSPQILKDPKSLYHNPSGASGSDSLQSLSW